MSSFLRSLYGAAGTFGGRFNRWVSQLRHRRATIAGRMMGVVLTFAVPLNLVVVAAFWHFSERANEVQRTGLLYMARTLEAAVDAKLGEYIALAQKLAHSPALLNGDRNAFEAEARVAAASSSDASVLVADLDGQRLAGPESLPGQRLPGRDPLSFAAQSLASTGAVVIGGVREVPVSQTWVVDIEVPIIRDGQPIRSLSVAVNTQAFSRLLNERQLPENWIVGIIDGQGRYIACVPDGRTGQVAFDGWRQADDQDGVFEFVSVEGDRAAKAGARSPTSGWVIVVAIKHPFLQTAVLSYVRWATVLTVGLSVLGILFASAIARGITGSIEELRLKAGALVSGRTPSMPAAYPAEVGELWKALERSAAERDRSHQELRESQQKLRLALDGADLGTWRWEAGNGTREMQWDPRCRALFGLSAEDPVTYEVWASFVAPEDRARAEANVARALDPADPRDESFCEYRAQLPDGTVRWVSSMGRVFFEADPASASGRRAAFMAGVIRDVTEAHKIEEQLRKSEERLRLSTEAAGIGTFTIDVEAGCVDYSPELAAILGFPAISTVRMEDALARIYREDEARVRALFEAAFLGKGARELTVDFRFVLPGGEVRWMTWAGRVDFRDGPSRRTPFRIFGACVDITERKRHEERIDLLMHGVNHRSKNMLSVVLAIARQTAAAEPVDFVERFGERVQALALSQDLLIKNEWRGVELYQLVQSQLAHFRDLIGTRIELRGPSLLISASAAQTIGMALHELGTNAGKYGALSAAGGRVKIEWGLERSDAGQAYFSMSWRENCGHEILPPSKAGFGTTVLVSLAERSLDAKVELDFAIQGLSWKL